MMSNIVNKTASISPETHAVTVRITKTLLEKIDNTVNKGGYRSRQEVILEAVREFFEEHKKGAD